MKGDLKKIIKELESGTFRVRKVGKKYRVRDVVEYDGDYGLMSENELREFTRGLNG